MLKLIRALALACALGVVAAPAASAQEAIDVVRAAKAECIIGEQVDGFLGVVDRGALTADIRAAMDEINLLRRARYAELAREQGASLEVVARLTGEEMIRRAGAGQCVLDDTGEWRER